MSDEQPRTDHWPDTPAHRDVRDTMRHITEGKVIPDAKRALRDVLDKLEAQPTGRAKTDQSLGRAVGTRS